MRYVIDHDRGLARQEPPTVTASYDRAYFDKYTSYKGTDTWTRLNDFRVSFAAKLAGCGVYDVGIGDGSFLEKMSSTGLTLYGWDINPAGMSWLLSRGLCWDLIDGWPPHVDVITCFDVLEHMTEDELESFVAKVPVEVFLACSLPILDDWARLDRWKHSRLGEHLTLFTRDGFVGWMERHGFDLIKETDEESHLGREDILSFAFLKSS